jgi:ABC-type sugar transport system substrate-binding protein
MALGAIEAIKAAGKVPGKDIKIVSIDGVKDGMTALANGEINYIVECNPLLGPDLADIIKTLDSGGTVEPRIVTHDDAFDQAAAKEALPTRQY